MAQDTTPILLRRRALLMKAEATTGTAETLAAATDGDIVVFDAAMKQNVPLDEREAINSLETLTGVPGARMGELTFRSELAGKGAVGVPFWASTLLPACGGLLTSQTFTFISTAATIPTLTFGLYENGRVRTLTGAQGTFRLELENGKKGNIFWTFRGLLSPDADVAMVTPTITNVLPPRWANASAVTLGAYNPILSKCSIDLANDVQMREDANRVEGYRSALIVDRKPRATIDPEAALVATQPWFTQFAAGTEQAFSCIVGTTTNNIVTISAPKTQIYQRPVEERNGKVTEGGVVLGFNRGTSIDTSLSIAFT